LDPVFGVGLVFSLLLGRFGLVKHVTGSLKSCPELVFDLSRAPGGLFPLLEQVAVTGYGRRAFFR
jgi:hypothetical protein